MVERILKVFVEKDRGGKYSVLYTRKGLKDSVLIENLNKRQVEKIYSLLKLLGFDVFLQGAKADLEDLEVSKEAKIYLDDVFTTFRKLQPWEVLE